MLTIYSVLFTICLQSHFFQVTPTKPEPESGSLLLSRIPDSFDVEESELPEEMHKDKSLPIEIEKRLQYFSEPELSPGTSPMGSRPGNFTFCLQFIQFCLQLFNFVYNYSILFTIY